MSKKLLVSLVISVFAIFSFSICFANDRNTGLGTAANDVRNFVGGVEDTVENAAETGSTEEYPQEISQDSSEVNVDFEDDFTDTPAETVQEENLEAAEEAADFSAGDDEETVQPETVTYTKLINNDIVEVKAEAEAGTLPEGAELNVTPVEKETEQYTAVENVLTSLAQNKETKLDGFLTYNVSFTDSEGLY